MSGFDYSQLIKLLPVGVILASALVVVLLGLILESKDRYVLPMVALGGTLLGLAALGHNYFVVIDLHHAPAPWFSGLTEATNIYDPRILKGAFSIDGFGMVIALVVLIGGALSIMIAPHEEDDSALKSGEYYGLLMLAVAGMMCLGFSYDFLTLLISLEIMSIATYILSGSQRGTVRSSEAALKYLVLGGFSTAFFMLGIAFIYGGTGSLSLAPVDYYALAKLSAQPHYLVLAGMSLVFVGLLFKVGAVPFHFWIPDVYEGAPTGVTSLMAVGVKAAAFAVLGRILFGTFSSVNFRNDWTTVIMAAAVLTMALGNLLALQQTSVKRMLAYSGIAHTGYLLLTFLVNPGLLDKDILQSVIPEHLGTAGFYLLSYGVMTAGAFGVVGMIREDGRRLETFDDFRGLAKEHPGMALCMAIFMLSLAGIPPFAGFFAKFMLFKGAVAQGYIYPAVIGVLTSVISLGYYLRVIATMYMDPEVAPQHAPTPARCRYVWSTTLMIYAAGVVTLLLGLLPNWAPGFF